MDSHAEQKPVVTLALTIVRADGTREEVPADQIHVRQPEPPPAKE